MEQHRQRARGIYDPERIAQVSLNKTRWAIDLALATAIEDQDVCEAMNGKRKGKLNGIKAESVNRIPREIIVNTMACALHKMRLEDILDANTKTHTSLKLHENKNASTARSGISNSNIPKRAAGFGIDVIDDLDELLLVRMGMSQKQVTV